MSTPEKLIYGLGAFLLFGAVVALIAAIIGATS